MVGDKSFIENVNYVAGLDGKFGSVYELSADNIPVALSGTYSVVLEVGTYSFDTLEEDGNAYTVDNVTADQFDQAVGTLVASLNSNVFIVNFLSRWNQSVLLPQKEVKITLENTDSSILISRLVFRVISSGVEVVSVAGAPINPKQILPKIASIPDTFISDANRLADILGGSAADIQVVAETVVPNLDAILNASEMADTVIDLAAQAQVNVDKSIAALEAVKNFSVNYIELDQDESGYAEFDPETNIVSIGVPKGQTGDTGQQGETGVGIVSILKTDTVGNVDTYTITYSDLSTSTFNVSNGIDGVNGADGIDGLNGIDGVDGIGIQYIEKTNTVGNIDTYTVTYSNATTFDFTVTNGVDGINGTNGTDGTNGKDVYQLALETGFVGTLEEFIEAYRGPQGPQGAQGETGLQGIQGVQGIQGPQGATGAQGVSLVILGQVANVASLPDPSLYTLDQAFIVQDTGDLWFVDETSNWANAGRIVGPEGPQGQQGVEGPQGAVGPRGLTGATGLQGPQGIQGLRGATGANGIDGTSITNVSSSKVGTVTTVTIDGTFAGAPYQFTVEDGSGAGDMLQSVYDPTGSGKVQAAELADAVAWNNVTGKPSVFTPDAHTHSEYVLVSSLGTVAEFEAALG